MQYRRQTATLLDLIKVVTTRCPKVIDTTLTLLAIMHSIACSDAAMPLLLLLTVHSTLYYVEHRNNMTSRHRTFSDWQNYCSPDCGCREMSDFDIDTLLVHHWDFGALKILVLKV